MFPAEALPATWMEEQFDVWEERKRQEALLKASKTAPVVTTQPVRPALLTKPIDPMPSPSATSAYFGWCSPLLGRFDTFTPNLSRASSVWSSPQLSGFNWGTMTPTASGASTPKTGFERPALPRRTS